MNKKKMMIIVAAGILMATGGYFIWDYSVKHEPNYTSHGMNVNNAGRFIEIK